MTQEATSAPSAVCWLIERRYDDKNFYLVAEHYGGLDWTEDPHKAQRFPAEHWARKLIDRTILNTFDDLRVEEHMFLTEPESTPVSAPDAGQLPSAPMPIQKSTLGYKPAHVARPVYLRAYEVYCELYGPQDAIVTGTCRSGFGLDELTAFLYAHSFPKAEWRDRVDEAYIGMQL